MNNNIIFLDIDGVLNNNETYIFTKNSIDTVNIKLFLEALKYIKTKKEIKIVISSSWRHPDLNGFIKYVYKVCGEQNEIYINQLLTYLHEDYCTKKITTFNAKRGDEVKEWLSRHSEVEKYICIDDDSDFLKNQPLLQTFPEYGFRYDDMLILQKYFINESKDIEFILDEIPYFKKRLSKREKLIKSILQG